MKSVGIICEYNPFHNGHLYHINKIKEMFPEHTIILIMSTSFTERGEISIINKFDKTKIALAYGVDMVIELPFPFASQSADLFAKGSVSLLNELKCEYIIFGSESDDIELLKSLAKIQIDNSTYDNLVKKYLDSGLNYPTAMGKALNIINGSTINKPNDLLGLSYVKEIINNKYNITPVTIKRTNNYHSLKKAGRIISASAIRNLIEQKKSFKKYVPKVAYQFIDKNNYSEKLFEILKYKIVSTNDLSIYQTVDEGIENRIKKYINKCDNLNSFIECIKTKRYTYNKISRMIIHIICDFTKEDAKSFKSISYIRVLGFTSNGQKYLQQLKKYINIPIITNPKNSKDKMLELEHKVTDIYNLITNNNINDRLEKPIIKK